jgi:hypothetical protein
MTAVATPLDWPSLIDGRDYTAAINAALATGVTVDLLGMSMQAGALVQTADCQEVISSKGLARIYKNADGDLFTTSGHDVRLSSVIFNGNTRPGHNVVSSGDAFTMRDCGSRNCQGRAVKATGTKYRLQEGADIYQSLGEYDIEVGSWGAVTQSHNLSGFESNQSTGGLLFIQCGSHKVSGWQGGKLTIDSDFAEGTNAGQFSNCRVLGDVTINANSGQFDCKFGAVDIVLGVGTTGNHLGANNDFQNGCTITDNGNNHIERRWWQDGHLFIRYGDDSSDAVIRMQLGSIPWFRMETLILANNTGLRLENADGTEAGYLTVGTTGDMTIHNNNTDKTLTLSTTGTGSRSQVAVNGTVEFIVDSTGPHT